MKKHSLWVKFLILIGQRCRCGGCYIDDPDYGGPVMVCDNCGENWR